MPFPPTGNTGVVTPGAPGTPHRFGSGSVGYPQSLPPQPGQPGSLFTPPATPGRGAPGGGAFGTGGASEFLNSLYSARPAFIQQQGDVLSQLGPGLRNSIFSASPELAAAAQYYQQAFSDPYGGRMSTYQDALRSAQAARGFTGGGSGVVGEEARYLSNYATQRQDALLPGMIGFGQQILANSGLQAPPDITFSALAGAAVAGNAQNAQGQQSALAQQMYQQQINAQNAALSNPYGARRPGGAGGVGGGSFTAVGSSTGGGGNGAGGAYGLGTFGAGQDVTPQMVSGGYHFGGPSGGSGVAQTAGPIQQSVPSTAAAPWRNEQGLTAAQIEAYKIAYATGQTTQNITDFTGGASGGGSAPPGGNTSSLYTPYDPANQGVNQLVTGGYSIYG